MILVVGLAFEARIAAGPGVQVICSGDGRNLAARLTAAIAEARQLPARLSGNYQFRRGGRSGAAIAVGGMCRRFRGSLRFDTDADEPRMVTEIARDNSGCGVRHAPRRVGAEYARPNDKHALYVKTGAIAVDMESHIVAAVGAAHGLPVAAIRVITDPAKRTLPASAVAAMRPNGTTNIGAMIRSVLMRPRELPALIKQHSTRARRGPRSCEDGNYSAPLLLCH